MNLGTNPPVIPSCDTNSANVEAEDICSAPVITCSLVDVTNDCLRTRTLTYTATDVCGNSTNCVQVVTWTVANETTLSIVLDGNNVVLSWPLNCNMFVLEQTSDLNPTSWTPVGAPIVVSGARNTVTVPITANTFYRLRFTPP